MANKLVDTFGRKQHYLRISLTDKCNFRCQYCMPAGHVKFMPGEKLMTAPEITSLASVFVKLGVDRIRLTGGEPTLRSDLEEIMSGLSALDVGLSMTSNGFLLADKLEMLSHNGLMKLNISLDSLDNATFTKMARREGLDQVLQAIDRAIDLGFEVKINTVVIRGMNEEEIPSLIHWTTERGIPIRFIEYMPFSGNEWEYSKVFSKAEMLELIGLHFKYIPQKSPADSTSVNYSIPASGTSFGIISTISEPFCSGCSRIRLTADGKVRNCLFSGDENDLLSALRSGGNVEELILHNIFRKKAAAAGKVDFSDERAKVEYAKNRPMVAIGG